MGALYLSEQERLAKQSEVSAALSDQLAAVEAAKEAQVKQLQGDFEKLLERVTKEFEKDTEEQLADSRALFEAHRGAFLRLLDQAQQEKDEFTAEKKQQNLREQRLLVLLENLF